MLLKDIWLVCWHICCTPIACCPPAAPSKGWGLLAPLPLSWSLSHEQSERNPEGTRACSSLEGDAGGHLRAQAMCCYQQPTGACSAQIEARVSSSLLEFLCWISVVLARRNKASTSDFYPVWHVKICWGTLLEALEGPNNMEPITLETYDMYNVASEVFISCPKQLHQHF